MATRRRPSMSDPIDNAAPASTTPIARGLNAFSAQAALSTVGGQVEVPIDLIDPSPKNPPSSLGDLKDLAASIKELGVLEPVLIRRNGVRYDLIYGHRRYAAAKLAKRATVPAVFTADASEDYDVKDRVRRLVENLHREDLSPLDEARVFQELLDIGVEGRQFGLARRVSKSQTHVSRRLALLKLPEDVQARVDSGEITLTDALELAKLADDPRRVEEALKGAARGVWGGLAATVKRQLQDLEDERSRQAHAQRLRSAGVKVSHDAPNYSRQHGPYPLHSLAIDVDEHAQLDCHGAVIPSHGSGAILVCFDPQAHLGTEDEQIAHRDAAAAAARAELQAAEEAAARSRREFTTNLVRKGPAGAGAAVLMGQLIGKRHYYARVDEEMVAELLGIDPDSFKGGPSEAITAYVAKGTRNGQRAAYAAGVALGESATVGHHAHLSARVVYFDHLVACGYQLSEFEKDLIAEPDDDEGAEAATEVEAAAGATLGKAHRDHEKAPKT